MDSSAGESLWVDVTIHGHGELAIRFDQGMYAEYWRHGWWYHEWQNLIGPSQQNTATHPSGWISGWWGLPTPLKNDGRIVSDDEIQLFLESHS